MRITRFVSRVVFLNLLAFLYLHQQVSLIKVSYEIRLKEHHLAFLGEENRDLYSRFLEMKSPRELEKTLAAAQGKFRMPEAREVVQLTASSSPVASRSPRSREEMGSARGILSFLIFRSQAEAETIE